MIAGVTGFLGVGYPFRLDISQHLFLLLLATGTEAATRIAVDTSIDEIVAK